MILCGTSRWLYVVHKKLTMTWSHKLLHTLLFSNVSFLCTVQNHLSVLHKIIWMYCFGFFGQEMRGLGGTGHGGVSMAEGWKGQGARWGNVVRGQCLPSPPRTAQKWRVASVGQVRAGPIDKLDEACTNADDWMMLVQHRSSDCVMS